MGSCFKSRQQKKSETKQVERKGQKYHKQPEIKIRQIILCTNEGKISPKVQLNQPLAQILNSYKNNTADISQTRQKTIYPINNDNLDIFIKEASQQQDKQEAVNLFTQIIQFIKANNDESFQSMEKLAFTSASLADLCLEANYGDPQPHQQTAYKIYKQVQTTYYEQLIIVINNSALRHQKNKQLNEAIEKYKQIIQIQKKYYSIDDERKIVSLNNLACAYCQNDQSSDGIDIFQKLKINISSRSISKQIEKMILQNYIYYKSRANMIAN